MALDEARETKSSAPAEGSHPVWGEFADGAFAVAPLVVASIPFGLILGSQAVRAGLSPLEVLLMSAMVFAGSAQFLSITLWQHPAPWATIALATLLINLRHVMLSASIVRKMEGFRPWQRWLGAFWLTDESWATCERRAHATRLTPAFYFGAGLTMYVDWLCSTGIGAALGELLPQPERFGLDFAFPAVFICIVMGFAKSWRALPIIGASAAVALAAHASLGGAWYVILGALAGILTAVLLPEPRAARA